MKEYEKPQMEIIELSGGVFTNVINESHPEGGGGEGPIPDPSGDPGDDPWDLPWGW